MKRHEPAGLADLYREQGKPGEAEPLCRRAIAIGEKAVGPDHPLVGTSLSGLVDVYEAQGNNAEAEPLAQRALAIKGKAAKEGDPGLGSPPDLYQYPAHPGSR